MKSLIPLVLILGVVLFSGCNSGDTTGGEQAKAEEEPHKKLIAEVMEFLEGEDFSVSNDSKTEDSSFGVSSSRYSLDLYTYEFEYDEKTESLVILSKWHSEYDFSMINENTAEETSSGLHSAILRMEAVDLKSCGPVIRLVDDSRSDKIQRVVLTGNSQIKSLAKRGEWEKKSDRKAARQAGAETPEDWEDLRKKDFVDKSYEGEKIVLVVKKDIAPRLKAALGDLLKAHGVKPSKY